MHMYTSMGGPLHAWPSLLCSSGELNPQREGGKEGARRHAGSFMYLVSFNDSRPLWGAGGVFLFN